MVKNFNSSKSNTSKVDGGGGGDGPDPQMGSKVDLHHGSKAVDGGGGPEPQMGKNFNSSKSNTSTKMGGGRGGGSVSGVVKRTVGKTLGMAKMVIITAVLISVAGAGVDVYQTYNDAISIDLEKHITDADFELSDDKSEISGTVGFDIPEMGMFEKSIIVSMHVTVLESNPTTDGDYEFEYTLGNGEQFYDFTLDDLDPVTVEKIEAGESLDIEYSGTISVTYLGVEIPSVTMDIPLTTTTVETA